jgi:hypothetical protein
MVQTDMEDFIDELNSKNWGVVSFNTYTQNGNCCFIMVSERGDSGRFIKKECFSYELNHTLQIIIDEIRVHKDGSCSSLGGRREMEIPSCPLCKSNYNKNKEVVADGKNTDKSGEGKGDS